MLVQGLVRIGWKFRFYYDKHPLGKVPCVELSKQENDKAEYHTFYSVKDVWDWLREPEEISNVSEGSAPVEAAGCEEGERLCEVELVAGDPRGGLYPRSSQRKATD